MKKLFIFIILAFMCGTAQAYAELYYKQDFEGANTEAVLAEFTKLTRGHTITVGKSSDNRYGEIGINMAASQGSPYIDKKISVPETDDVIFEISVNVTNSDNLSENIVCIRNSKNELVRILDIKNKTVYTGSGAATVKKVSEGEFNDIQIALHLKKKTYDVYADGEIKVKNAALGAYSVPDITTFRIMTMSLKDGSSNIFAFDNIMLYDGSEPASEAEKKEMASSGSTGVADMVNIRERVKNVLFFYAESDRVFYKARLLKMPYKAFSSNEKIYVPLRFIIETVEGSVTCGNDGLRVVLNGNETLLQADGENIINKDGCAFISTERLAGIMGTEVQTDRTGFSVIGGNEYFYDWDSEREMLTQTIGCLNFKRPDGNEVLADVIKNSSGVHPRIYASEEDFVKLRQAVNSGENSFITKTYNRVKTSADSIMNLDPLPFHMQDHIRALGQIQAVVKRIQELGAVYHISGERRYAERGIQEVMGFCSDELWPDWNPYQILGIGEAAYAAALGYDLFYNEMTEEQRAFIREKIQEKAFAPYMDDMNGLTVADQSGRPEPYTNKLIRSTLLRSINGGNWHIVVNGGITAAAAAICDSEDSRENCVRVLNHSVKEMEKGLSGFLPDGAWYEGCGYWNYTTQYLARGCRALEGSCKTDYGVGTAPGLSITADYIFGIQGPGGSFNFSDAGESYLVGTNIFYLAKKYNEPSIAKAAEKFMNRHGLSAGCEALEDYVTVENTDNASDIKLDNYWRDIETVTLRSSTDDTTANFIGLHGGKNNATHAQLDTGTIVLDALGKRFISDLGTEDYNLNSAGGPSGMNLYRKNPQGHNLICFNPTTAGVGQNMTAGSVITDYKTNRADAFAVTDLKYVWSDYVTEYKRGIRLTNERTVFVLQDEYKLKPNVNEMYWFIHTKGNITLSEDKRSAVITIDNVSLTVKLLTDNDGEFMIMDALPLEGSESAKISGQNQNIAFKKLAFKFNTIEDGTFAVAFIPANIGMSELHETPVFEPISNWRLQDDSDYTENEKEVVSMIYIDGEPLENFDSETASYDYVLPFGENEIPDIASDADAQVIKGETVNAPSYVVAGSGGTQNVYTIRFLKQVSFEAPENSAELEFSSLEASAEPQPQNGKNNVYDGDFDTRWSALAPCSLTYDLGSKKKIDYAGIAYYLGDERQTEIKIEVSDDGENWETKFNGLSSGKTKTLEYYDLEGAEGRYIKVSGMASSNGWVSIAELKFYSRNER